MKKLKALASDKADCGITAIKMILDYYDLDYTAYDDIVYGTGVSHFGELLNSSQVNNAFHIIPKLLHAEMREFSNIDELKNIIESSVEEQKHILIPYYAFQGFVFKNYKIISSKPDMKHVHWGIIDEANSNSVSGKQSNIKADLLNCLIDVELECLLESNKLLDSIKVDFGKYHKCKIDIAKKELGTIARCGLEQRCEICNTMKSDSCIYNCDLGGKAWVVSGVDESNISEESNGKFETYITDSNALIFYKTDRE